VFYADLRISILLRTSLRQSSIAEHLLSRTMTSTSGTTRRDHQRTKRVRINTAVAVVPFNHTPRMTSDFA
jgi:hypothetical protein